MITGKFLILKGLALLVAVVAAIIALIGCIMSREAIPIIAAVINLGTVGLISYKLHGYWSGNLEE